uniref:Uncharacterized protein n=1 Tax=Candidatus Kentrum sp. FW TaxID=2126338 RepID=A0A450T5N9_9GAMM|nr:MAG: hypothetical protein BECKFW1821A_GA0114235_111710 [Candidatus Kentron sp. FW]
MLKAPLKSSVESIEYTAVGTGDEIELGGRTLRFLNTPFLHWPDTQCTYLAEEGVLFSGDIFGCHYCDRRLFDDLAGDFDFSFDYYHARIMRPFKAHLLEALELIEPLEPECIAPAHGPILRERPGRYIDRYWTLSGDRISGEEIPGERALVIFYASAYGNTARMAEEIGAGAGSVEGIKVSLYDIEGSEIDPFVDLIEADRRPVAGFPHHQWRRGKASVGSTFFPGGHQHQGEAWGSLRLLRLDGRGGPPDRGTPARTQDARSQGGIAHQADPHGRGTGGMPRIRAGYCQGTGADRQRYEPTSVRRFVKSDSLAKPSGK